jgi:glycosyltransferase involved in cell wall biosynthesis
MVEMSLPSKLTSYLRAGRPVVAATTPGSATDDFVTASGGGIVVPAGDPDAIVNAVIDITSADRQLSDFAVRGAEFARQHLSEERALAAYDEWVDELTATREQPREVAGAATQRRAGPRPQR